MAIDSLDKGHMDQDEEQEPLHREEVDRTEPVGGSILCRTSPADLRSHWLCMKPVRGWVLASWRAQVDAGDALSFRRYPLIATLA